jgi:hypothetical protein
VRMREARARAAEARQRAAAAAAAQEEEAAAAADSCMVCGAALGTGDYFSRDGHKFCTMECVRLYADA